MENPDYDKIVRVIVVEELLELGLISKKKAKKRIEKLSETTGHSVKVEPATA